MAAIIMGECSPGAAAGSNGLICKWAAGKTTIMGGFTMAEHRTAMGEFLMADHRAAMGDFIMADRRAAMGEFIMADHRAAAAESNRTIRK